MIGKSNNLRHSFVVREVCLEALAAHVPTTQLVDYRLKYSPKKGVLVAWAYQLACTADKCLHSLFDPAWLHHVSKNMW
jgi:hypothetical protein